MVNHGYSVTLVNVNVICSVYNVICNVVCDNVICIVPLLLGNCVSLHVF